MSHAHRDQPLDALLHPFATGQLRWPSAADILFLRAREGAALHGLGVRGLATTQPFKPEAERLQRVGAEALDEDALPVARYPLVLALPPRQREEARALLAKACAAVAPGGMVVASVANDEGAKSREADLRQLAGGLTTISKHHCRVSWTRPDTGFDAALLAQWSSADAPRVQRSADVPGGEFRTRPGVFAWDRVDAASRMLADALPADLAGRVADFGAGWGYLSMQVLARCPNVVSLDLYEADARALALADDNLGDARVPVHCHWHDVARGVGERFDAIVCNPPFHTGRASTPALGQQVIEAAARALKRGGRFYMVANRGLPYEPMLKANFTSFETLTDNNKFRVSKAVR